MNILLTKYYEYFINKIFKLTLVKYNYPILIDILIRKWWNKFENITG
jgi:hypothetical protein